MSASKKKAQHIVVSLQTVWQSLSTMTLGLLPTWSADTPVARVIRQTAKRNKNLLALNLGFAFLLGLSEATLFSMIYRVIQVVAGAPLPAVLARLEWPRGVIFTCLLASVLLLQLIGSFSRGMNSTLSGYFAARCHTEIVPRIHNYILDLSYTCASGFKAGDLIHRATVAPKAINVELENGSQLLSDALLTIVYLMVLVFISPWLMLLAFALAISLSALQSWLRPRIQLASRRVENQQREISSALTADLQVLKVLHSSAAITRSNEKFHEQVHGLELKLRKLVILKSLLEPIAELMPIVAVVVLGLFSWRISDGNSALMIPGLATFVLALQRLNIKLVRISKNANLLAENLAQIELLNELLETKDKAFRRKGGYQFTGLKELISFKDVAFKYSQSDKEIIHSIDFDLHRDKKIALVGASGAGKSTIADLLVGILSPTRGRIMIDGVDLQTINLNSWQRHLGVVSQEVSLINDTIYSNIAFGLEREISNQDVYRAAQIAYADEFIEQLPHKYKTIVGENGHRLSGGQRQRLSLARAILRNPEILILDEATSALDSQSEANVHDAIMNFTKGRTVLAIAHRLGSIQDASEILYIQQGMIIERGNHSELLNLKGSYAALWERQLRKNVASRN